MGNQPLHNMYDAKIFNILQVAKNPSFN